MPSWIEFRLAIEGLLRLARFNPDFQRFFDRSASGALRSFWLILPIFPFYLFQLWTSGLSARADDELQFYLAMSVGFVIRWLVPLVLIAWLAPLIGRDAEMPGCIAIYNWSSLLNVAVSVPFLLLTLAGVSDDSLSIFNDLLMLVILAWEVFLLARALRIPLWQALAATVADYFITNWILLSIFLVVGGFR